MQNSTWERKIRMDITIWELRGAKLKEVSCDKFHWAHITKWIRGNYLQQSQTDDHFGENPWVYGLHSKMTTSPEELLWRWDVFQNWVKCFLCSSWMNEEKAFYTWPWEEPGRLQSIGSQRVGHDCSDLAWCIHCSRHDISFSSVYSSKLCLRNCR